MAKAIICYLLFQCTKRICRPEQQQNRDVIERYRLRHGKTGTLTQCYYAPGHVEKDGAILRRGLTTAFFVHIICWPMGLMFLGILLFLGLYVDKHRRVQNVHRGHRSKQIVDASGTSTTYVFWNIAS